MGPTEEDSIDPDQNESVSLLPQNQQEGNQSENNLSTVQTPTRQSHKAIDSCKDIFDEILYSVSVNKENGRITILFSTRELYTNFMDNFKRGFQSKDPKDVTLTFKTHIQNRKCVVTAHDPENGISLTGPGNKLWRETIFPKLAVKLYRQYEQKVNELLAENSPATPIPTPVMSSTPGFTGNPDNGPRQTVAAQRASENLLKTVEGAQTEMKEQMVTLMSMLTSLQGQFYELKTNLTFENTESSEISTVTLDLSHQNGQDHQSHDNSHNESLGHGEPSVNPGVGTSSEAIQINCSPTNTQNRTEPNEPRSPITSQSAQNEPRPSNNTSHSAPRSNVNNSQNKKTLLIGDSLLSGVNGKGMKNFVHCQPVPGATIDKLKEKISMYDLSQFKDIIIYCGGNDAAKSDSPNSFRKEYENFLQHIRSKNSDCELFLCGSSPRGDVDVTGFNTVIKTIAESQGYKFVNLYDAFYDNNEQLRTKFYGLRDWIHLSTPGIRRLLGTIHQMIPIVEDFRYCAYPQDRANVSKHLHQNTGRNSRNRSSQQQRDNIQLSGSSQFQYGTSTATNQLQENRQSYQRSSYYSRGSSQPTGYANEATYTREQAEWPVRGNQETNAVSQQYSHPHENAYGYEQTKPKERCTKCGLTNHSTYECRHKRQLLCYACNFYGHKDSICWNQ